MFRFKEESTEVTLRSFSSCEDPERANIHAGMAVRYLVEAISKGEPNSVIDMAKILEKYRYPIISQNKL